ncbi:23716_t:CDS:1, partial [Gigaspora rosea]
LCTNSLQTTEQEIIESRSHTFSVSDAINLITTLGDLWHNSDKLCSEA